MDNLRHGMCSNRPAEQLRDALISGNGMMRIQVFGHPYSERILIGHERLYVPQWRDAPEPPDISAVMPDVKRLLLEGQYEAASDLAIDSAKALGGADIGYSELHNAAALHIDMKGSSEVSGYLRTLNMTTGEVAVCWQDDIGGWSRRGFVSRADHIVVTHIVPPHEQAMELRIRMSPYAETDHEWDPARWLNVRPDGSLDFQLDHSSEGIWTAVGTYKPEVERGGFAVVSRIVAENSVVRFDGDSCIVTGEGPVLLLTRVVLLPRGANMIVKHTIGELEALSCEYEQLLERHSSIHRDLFSRAALDLDCAEERCWSVEELMEKQLSGEGLVPALVEKLFDMGRYYLITYTGELPPLYGHVNINVNLQLSSGNLVGMREVMEVYFVWVEKMLDDSRLNARRLLGTRGFQFAAHPDAESGLLYHFFKMYPHHYWLSGSGWVLQPFLEYYWTTGDQEFLQRRLLPLYEELAEVYEDFLTEKDEYGKYIFVPSYSPENKPAGLTYPLAVNAVMDISICKEVLSTLLAWGSEAEYGKERMELWRSLLENMPSYAYGIHGELKEWAWPGLEDRFDHRHVSHLYGAWPGFEFNSERTPEMFYGASIANRKRAQEDNSAHGIAHRALVAARLRDHGLVYALLKQLLEGGFVNTSLMTNHYPYRFYFPDALGALPTVLIESVIFSEPGLIKLLPVNLDVLKAGVVYGMHTRSFLVVNRFRWDMRLGEIELEVTSLREQEVRISCPGTIKRIDSREGTVTELEQNGSDFKLGMMNRGECKFVKVQLRLPL